MRRHSPRPLEDLESRDVPAAGALGLNLSSMGFVDLMKEPSGVWSGNGVTPLTVDSLGYPTSDANILVLDERVNQAWNGPDPNANSPDIGGTYHLSFHGQATVGPPGWLQIYTVQNQVYDPATNVTTADLVVPHDVEPFLYLTFANTTNPESATGAGVSDVHLIQPGYAANTTQLFSNNFLNALKPFGTLRYLNITEANDFGPSNNNDVPLNWSQRRLPDEASQDDNTGGQYGEAWEYMVALANTTNTDMWITIPGTATDDYVNQLAGLIKNGDTVGGVTYAGLNPNLKVYVEYSNEVWGGIYNPYATNLEEAEAEVAAGGSKLNNDGINDNILEADRRYLERSMQVGNIFRGAFGGDPTFSKIRPVLGWQENNWQYYVQTFPWFEANYGAPSQSFYGMGNAIYWNPTDTSSTDAIIASLAAEEPATFANMQQFTAVADYYGLRNVSYEGGPALYGASSPAALNAEAASRDPRMEALVYQHYLDFYAAGGDVANFFDGPYEIWAAQYGIWGAAELSQASDPSLSPKYRGLLDVANAPPEAPTVGLAVSATGPTSLPVNADALGQSFNMPDSGGDNYWLLNVASAGTYDLQMTTGVNNDFAAKFEEGEVEVRLANQQVVGDYHVQQAGTFGLGTVPLHAGLNILVIHTVHGTLDPSDPYKYRFEYDPTSLTILPMIRTATVGGPGASETGTWTHDGTYDETGPGPATATASWTFNVTPGVYRVSASWNAQANYSSAVPYTILDGSNALATVPVNQKQAPSGFSDGTTTWQDLGTSFVVLGNTLTVRESNAPDGSASAQSIRIQQVQQINSPEVVNDNSDLQFATTGNWYHLGDYLYDPGGSGALLSPANGSGTATWTIPVTPGLDKISTIWPGGSGFSVDATYSLFDQSKLIATIPVNQSVAPTGYNDGSVTWQDLGGPYQIQGTTLTVVLNSSADGQVEAQAIRVQLLPSMNGASFAGSDTTTQGTWRSAYGSDGYDISQDTSAPNPSIPSYASLSLVGQTNFLWAASTADVRGLQNAANTGRLAGTWYTGSNTAGASMDFDVSINDGQAHRVSVYADDWDSLGRSERFDVIDATTDQVLDSRTISNFQNGVYESWTIRGSVILRVTDLAAGTNAVVQGIFFGSAGVSTNSATYAGSDTTTQGSWRGKYGADGYDISQDTSKPNPVIPSYATLTMSGQSNYLWTASTVDVRGLQNAANTTRISGCWFTGANTVGASMDFNVSINDGKAHKVSIYADDWDSTGPRSQRFDLIDATTGKVLDTRTISNYQGGIYLSWAIQGNVIIRATDLVAGSDAVVQGVFFG